MSFFTAKMSAEVMFSGLQMPDRHIFIPEKKVLIWGECTLLSWLTADQRLEYRATQSVAGIFVYEPDLLDDFKDRWKQRGLAEQLEIAGTLNDLEYMVNREFGSSVPVEKLRERVYKISSKYPDLQVLPVNQRVAEWSRSRSYLRVVA
jgi:hypothetical protein